MRSVAHRLLVFAALLTPTLSHAQQTPTGDWQGVLSAGGAQLHLALHITLTPPTALSGTLDSLDQHANGIPLSAIAMQASTLSFQIAAIHGSYTGTLSADGQSLTGTWTQGPNSLPLTFTRGASSASPAVTALVPPAPPDTALTGTPEQRLATEPGAANLPPSAGDIAGTWTGSVNAGGTSLPVVLHISGSGSKLTATMDSPNQNASGIPVAAITRAGNAVHADIQAAGATFDGSLTPDLQTIHGTLTQAGQAMPLVLTRSTAATAPR